MAKRAPQDAATRKWRTPEQIIADLEAKIADVRSRAEAKKVKATPAGKLALAALRALDKGMDAAGEEGNSALRHALADARKAIGEHLEAAGIKLPKANMPRGRRPKVE